MVIGCTKTAEVLPEYTGMIEYVNKENVPENIKTQKEEISSQ